MNIQTRVEQILREEAAAILNVPVSASFEAAVHLILNCHGKVVTTGIGKAGYVAAKFAATLCSTGTVAVFLHPAEAAHGDLGVISPNDVLIAFSTSGKSREVVEVAELSRHLGLAHQIAVTSHPESELRDHCEVILEMGIVPEVGNPPLAPTSSILVMLAISDALAVTVMELRNFSAADFGLRHHGGYLGRISRIDNLPR